MEEFHTKWLTPEDKKLVLKYPLILLERDDEIISHIGLDEYNRRRHENTYCLLRYGFEFGLGWRNIADEFLQKCTDLVIKERETRPESYIHGCIAKSKFGSLRIQFNTNLSESGQKEYYKISGEAEEKSEHTCELCGNDGSMKQKRGWFSTRCEKCENTPEW